MPWAFVNSTVIGPKQSVADRKLVRSHVKKQAQWSQYGLVQRTRPLGKRLPAELTKYMHDFRPKKDCISSSDTSTQEGSGGDQNYSAEDATEHKKDTLGEQRNTALSLTKTLSPQRFDPFKTLPVEMDCEAEFLLYLYYEVMMPEKDFECFKYIWLRRSITNTMLFEALLATCAGYRKALYGCEETPSSLARKSDIINYINMALDDPARRTSDDVIGIVACLTATEYLCCNFQALEHHSSGLKRIVDLRGGLESFSTTSLLPSLILWADLLTAMVPGLRARFEGELNARPAAWIFRDGQQDILSALVDDNIGKRTIQDQNIKDAKDALYSMFHFSAMIKDMMHRNVAIGERYMVMDRLICLDRSILTSYERLNCMSSSSQPAILAGIVYLVTLFYTSQLLDYIESSSDSYINLKSDLELLIGKVDPEVHKDNQGLLEWLLYTTKIIC
ncbi:hypothetical protein F5884DRAFT_825627 [Xylogone sp. PMI_703]|nr:hypothetical protein F5884DRAFT_825627 [Xylogone sp. PMI_703]